MSITILPTTIPDVVLVEHRIFGDDRGFFYESFHKDKFHEAGLPTDFLQDNHSRSTKGVLRGLHYQSMEAPMAKLVRCTVGEILDVAVDLRTESPTFGQYASAILSAENKQQLFCPVGFAHGFLTLSDTAEVQYKCTGMYAPETEGALLWNDIEIGIDWGNIIKELPNQQPTLSAKDAVAQSFADYKKDPVF